MSIPFRKRMAFQACSESPPSLHSQELTGEAVFTKAMAGTMVGKEGLDPILFAADVANTIHVSVSFPRQRKSGSTFTSATH
jgi:hypothetical protein